MAGESAGRRIVGRQVRLTMILAGVGALVLAVGGLAGEKILVALGAVIMLAAPYIAVYIVTRRAGEYM